MATESDPEMCRELLIGDLVRLLPLDKADAPTFSRWSRDTAGSRLHFGSIVVPRNEEHWENRLEKANPYAFGVHTSAEGLVGECSLEQIAWNLGQAMLGISIARGHRGRGYGAEAVRLLLDFAFDELNLHRVGLGVFSYNTRAIAFYEKLGFVHEGRAREWGRRDGRRFDLVHMGILEPEWRRP